MLGLMAPHRLTQPGKGAVFLGSEQHACQVEAVSQQDALLRAPVDVPHVTFARIHLHSEDGVLDLDAVVRQHEGARAGTGYLLVAAFVDPPVRYRQALDRLALAIGAEGGPAQVVAAQPKAPTPAPEPPKKKTPTSARSPLAKTPTSARPTERQKTPTSSTLPSERARDRGDALAAVDTDPSAMLDLYRKALASDKKETKPEESGSLWDKLKRVANKKL